MIVLRVVRSVLFLAFALAVALPVRAGGSSPAAEAYMQDLGTRAISELTDPAIPRPEQEVRFRRLLDDHFDMAAIAKFALGRHWRNATEAQRAEFRQLFEDFIVTSYSARFGEYGGEAFRVSGSTTDNGDVIIVHSKIDMPSSEDIRVDWRLRGAGGGFAIIDIVVEGVSMAVTQRSEFASVIQSTGGIDGLLEALRAKNSQSADSSAAP